jgi:putative DNA primase/helicase
VVDRAKVEAFFDELAGLLAGAGCTEIKRGGGAARAERSGVDQLGLKGDPDAVAHAVALIPNDVDRDGYVTMCAAIKAACADDPSRGLEIYQDWCARWESGVNDPEEVERRWDTMKGPFSIGAQWIFDKAQAHGFNAAGEEFEALEPEPDQRPDRRPVQYSNGAMALRFRKQHGDEVKFVAATGRWRIWDGRVWAEDETELAFDLVVRLCNTTSGEALRTLQGSLAERTAMKLADGSTMTKVHRIARADRAFACTPAAWDTNPQILNTTTGVVDLRTGKLGPHDRALMCSRMTAVGPDFAMPIPKWLAFLEEITNGDADLQAYLRRWSGYCLTGSVEEHALFFGYGPGGNGKGTFANITSRILKDYAATATMEAFTASSYDRHSTELAMLHGARFVTARETEEGRFWAESRIKQITGGDPITARFMRRDNFTFQPQFKLFVIGNHMPKLRNVDDAIRRRMHMVNFLFKPAMVNKKLEEELVPEWPGILAWMVAGGLEWQRIGLQPPAVVLEATREYLAGEDLLGRWLEERTRPGGFSTTQELFEDFQAWCGESGEQASSKLSFARSLAGRGISGDRPGNTGSRGFKLDLPGRSDVFPQTQRD